MFHHFANWSGLEVLIVPIRTILLFIAPVFVMVGIGLPPAKGRLFLGFALPLMVLGTAMTFVDVTSGNAAMKAGGSTPAFQAAFDEYRHLAEITRELFVVLTLGFAALLFVPRLLGRELESRIKIALLAVYLLFYVSGALFLIQTALQGVHLARALDVKAVATYQLTGKGVEK